MIRLLGFVVGAGLAIAAILLILGVPELASEPVIETKPEASFMPEHTEPAPPLPMPEADPDPEPEIIVVEASAEQPAPVQPDPEERIEPRWHSFWSPFGSQIAANGFISRLEAVTGYDYRVVKIETGVYEVTFAYTSDEERRQMLAAIASATGLEIPDS